MAEVTEVLDGIKTEVTRRLAQAQRAECYLSLASAGRSVDLCFEQKEERDAWQALLSAVVGKEHNELKGVEKLSEGLGDGSTKPVSEDDAWEWYMLYSAIGLTTLPIDVVVFLSSSMQ